MCKLRLVKKLYLGNLYAKRDWGVQLCHRYVEDPSTKTLKLCNSYRNTYSIKQFIDLFQKVKMKISWKGEGL